MLYKSDNKIESYLSMIKNNKNRKAISRLRLSCHPLMIEKGRHRKPPLDRAERICPFCKCCTEDEIHFITECPLYEVERTKLYVSCLNTAKNFQLLTGKERFIFIMSNENPQILGQLGIFIYKGLKLREQFISETA